MYIIRSTRDCDQADVDQYSAVMGILEDLNLRGNDFSNIATFFFVAYIVAEIPNSECQALRCERFTNDDQSIYFNGYPQQSGLLLTS